MVMEGLCGRIIVDDDLESFCCGPGLQERMTSGYGTSTDSGAGAHRAASKDSTTVPGLLLGVGLGGFVDGIIIHQLLQWHHMGTDHDVHAAFPESSTVASLEDNTLWDGLFHAGTWVVSLVGLFMLWRALAVGHRTTWVSLLGLLVAGWGVFNIVEGLVNQQLLSIHHVRDDLGGPLSWDIGFLVFGAALTVSGFALRRADLSRTSNASGSA